MNGTLIKVFLKVEYNYWAQIMDTLLLTYFNDYFLTVNGYISSSLAFSSGVSSLGRLNTLRISSGVLPFMQTLATLAHVKSNKSRMSINCAASISLKRSCSSRSMNLASHAGTLALKSRMSLSGWGIVAISRRNNAWR